MQGSCLTFILTLSFFLLSSSLEVAASRIAVVGAGLSGLTVAYRLKQAGLDVAVFEARNRPGGRVFTVKVNGSVHELGGKVLSHGGDAKNIIQLLNELNLPVVTIKRTFSSFVHDEKSDHILSLYGDLLDKIPEMNAEDRLRLETIEAESANLQEVIERFFSDPLMRRLYETRMRTYEGADPVHLSSSYASGSLLSMLLSGKKNAEFTREKKELEISYQEIEGGGAKLVEVLAEELKSDLHLNQPLTRLKKSATGFRLSFGESELEEDFVKVIFTVPASVFKNIEMDEGAVSRERWTKMGSLAYGTTALIAVPFRQGGAIPGVVNTPHLSVWMENQGVMSFYYAGSEALMKNSREQIDVFNRDRLIVMRSDPELEIPEASEILRPSDEHFSQYSSPVGVFWAFEPYTQGGYSIYSPDQYFELKTLVEVDGEKVIEMFRPVGDKIFFSGEHTAIDYPATMEGAVESAERCARMVVRAQRRSQ